MNGRTFERKRTDRTIINYLKKKENILFMALSAMLVLIISACITLTVKGEGKKNASGYDEAWFDELEAEYKEGISGILSEYGMYYSGINLTKITMEDGTREYHLSIYNRKLRNMDAEHVQSLQEALCRLPFPEEQCPVYVVLNDTE